MLNGYWPWGRLWVDFALVAFAGSFLLGIAVLSRTAKRIEKVGPESDEGQQLIRRVFVLLRVDLLFSFAIVFAMVVKPTGDDWSSRSWLWRSWPARRPFSGVPSRAPREASGGSWSRRCQ